ncbi:hypothetical protein ACW73L_11675 [Methylolobus aquaticus]
MKNRVIGAFGVLAGIGLAPGVLAHTQGGSLGSPAAATDYYTVTCSDDGNGAPLSLAVQVQDLLPAGSALVSVTAKKGNAVTHSTDIGTDGDANPSPVVYLNGGSGVYDLMVSKSRSGAETYTLIFHCMTGTNGTGIHTGTSDPGVRQNQ